MCACSNLQPIHDSPMSPYERHANTWLVNEPLPRLHYYQNTRLPLTLLPAASGAVKCIARTCQSI